MASYVIARPDAQRRFAPRATKQSRPGIGVVAGLAKRRTSWQILRKPSWACHFDQGRRPRGEICLRPRGTFHSLPDVSTALTLRSAWPIMHGIPVTYHHDVHPPFV